MIFAIILLFDCASFFLSGKYETFISYFYSISSYVAILLILTSYLSNRILNSNYTYIHLIPFFIHFSIFISFMIIQLNGIISETNIGHTDQWWYMVLSIGYSNLFYNGFLYLFILGAFLVVLLKHKRIKSFIITIGYVIIILIIYQSLYYYYIYKHISINFY